MVKPSRPVQFSPVEPRRSSAGLAIDLIKSRIAAGELAPGQRLPSERDLAQQLGLSRPTVREAIRTLTVMNILVARHGDGTYVTSLTPELLTEPLDFVLSIHGAGIYALFEVRTFLESGAAALAAERADDSELDALAQLVDEVRADADDPEVVLEHDLALHRGIVAAARNPILASLLESLSGLSARSRARTGNLPGISRRTVQDHQAIVDALRTRDPEQASAAMAAHLGRVAASLREAEDERLAQEKANDAEDH